MHMNFVMGYLPGASAVNPYGPAYGGMSAMYGSGSNPYDMAYPGTSSVSTYSTPYQTQPMGSAPAGPYGYGSAPANREQAAAKERLAHVLDAMGVPSTNGRLDWPLGLRILPPGEKAEELRKQIEALLRMAANQAPEGKVSPQVVRETANAVEEMHEMLRKKKSAYVASYTYNEADQFLDKLAQGLKLLQ
jgi:hypothetical protein